MVRDLAKLVPIVVLTAACGRRAAPPAPARCAEVGAHPVPDREGPNRWSVELAVDGSVLRAHGARFRRLGIEPNGPAWAGVLEQCLAAEGTPLPRDVDLDPEASSLHAWVETDASKDRLVQAMCRAVHDEPWLDRCLSTIDRSKLDD